MPWRLGQPGRPTSGMVPPMTVDPLADTAAMPLAPADPPRMPQSVRWREVVLVASLLCAVYLPMLGSFQLWDPWEGHYGEVARRMMEDHDWVRLQWQNESFRSKPVLTFWLMAAGMKIFGLGNEGGYSGELAMSRAVRAMLSEWWRNLVSDSPAGSTSSASANACDASASATSISMPMHDTASATVRTG